MKNVRHTILTWKHKTKPCTRVQEEARASRYELLRGYMKEHKISLLFLGHHQDDQAETFLFRLAKGSGLDGLAGMKSIQDLENGVLLCRPLLSFSKADLVAYCKNKKIQFHLDASNDSEVFARVRMRKVMKSLATEGLTPERLGVTCKRLGRVRKALEEMSEKAFHDSLLVQETKQTVLKFSVLQNYPEEIGLRVLLKALEFFTEKDGYGPRLERVETLFTDLMKPEPFRKRTLSGVIFERKDRADKVILTPER